MTAAQQPDENILAAHTRETSELIRKVLYDYLTTDLSLCSAEGAHALQQRAELAYCLIRDGIDVW